MAKEWRDHPKWIRRVLMTCLVVALTLLIFIGILAPEDRDLISKVFIAGSFLVVLFYYSDKNAGEKKSRD